MNSSILVRCLCCAIAGVVVSVSAITPAEVQTQLNAGKQITFVDLRSRTAFQTGHIPNAISIPASLVPQKELPPLGLVVAYDDGLGADTATAAAAALNAKPGISALPLAGGFAAWESAQATVSTRAPGVSVEEIPFITYDRLKTNQSSDLVLVDLRKRPTTALVATDKTVAAQPLTDLAAEFPRARITDSPFATVAPAGKIAGAGSTPPPLMVLIDSGDGSAQQMARVLKANGVKRFVVLVGGEEMIARKGQPGLNRAGSSIVVRPSGAVNQTQ